MYCFYLIVRLSLDLRKSGNKYRLYQIEEKKLNEMLICEIAVARIMFDLDMIKKVKIGLITFSHTNITDFKERMIVHVCQNIELKYSYEQSNILEILK